MVRIRGPLVWRVLLLFIGSLSLSFLTKADAPKVVVSIAPLHSLVANIMEGVGRPDLLIRGAQSPHHFSLSPSHIQKLKDADVVIWVGDVLETFLIKPIQSFDKKAYSLIEAPSLKLLSVRGKPCDHGCAHARGVDPHIWLDIDNAMACADYIAHFLSQQDPQNQATYHQNAIRLKEKLGDLKKEILEQAQLFQGLKFICGHDAFHYYEEMVGIHNMGVLASAHSLDPSLKHLNELRKLLHQKKVSCVLSEPQSQSSLLKNLSSEFNLYNGIIDPLGANIEPGKDQYFLLLRNITQTFTNCFNGQHDS